VAFLFLGDEVGWGFRFGMSFATAGMGVFAVLLLSARDFVGLGRRIRAVRKRLLRREEMSEEQFREEFPHWSVDTAVSTRKALAKFFEVPPRIIYPNDELDEIYLFSKFEPQLRFFLVAEVRPDVMESGLVLLAHLPKRSFMALIDSLNRLRSESQRGSGLGPFEKRLGFSSEVFAHEFFDEFPVRFRADTDERI